MDREVKYRVNKYILRLLVQHDIISKADAAIIHGSFANVGVSENNAVAR